MLTGQPTGEASTFTIARGRDAGYRVLTAPEFLVSTRRTGVLSDLASADHPDGEVVHASSAAGEKQRVFLAYTTRTITDTDLDASGRQQLGTPPRDAFGRPLRIIYGVVSRGRAADADSPSRLAGAEHAALEAFRAFVADENGYRLQVAAPVGAVAADEPQATTAPPRPGQRVAARVAVGALAAGALVAVGLSYGVFSGGGHEPGTSATEPGTSPTAGRSPSSASASPSSSPSSSRERFSNTERILLDRISARVKDCASAATGDRITRADATLRCSVTDTRPDSPITVASFATPKALNEFLDEEEHKEADAKHTKDSFARTEQWKNTKGITIGRLVTYHDAAKKAWMTWSFEHDTFADDHRKSFVVVASGRDGAALYRWWLKHPI